MLVRAILGEKLHCGTVERQIVIYVYMTPNNNTYMLKWLFEDMHSLFSCKAKCPCVAAQLS